MFDQLKAFHATVRQGSITRAARHLGVSQPTIAAQIRQVEQVYGVELFYRSGRKLEVTETGIELLPLVEKMIALEAQADIMLRNVGGLFEGHLRIGATGPYYIMDAVGRFSSAHPSIALTCRIGNSEEILQALQEFRIDLAVSSQRNDADGLERKVISTDPLVLVVHRHHPLARFESIDAARLADVRLLMREEGSVTRRCTETILAAAGVAATSVAEIGSREAIREAILHGVGGSLFPLGEAERHPDLRVIALRGVDTTIDEYVYYLKARRQSPAIDAFLACILPGGGEAAGVVDAADAIETGRTMRRANAR
ncbi:MULTISPECIES: LysR family transcriptional regulator [Burkholderia cepacia complex]|uniref:LysR family transcriptional regulator n=1 Tax=Burkholderia cepacia complex TaxID=87882 RepID=UPI000F5ADF9B|nr:MULTISPECIES: LysR family transcriptional regulator [Burkholderia cepacia complex]MCA7965522.1 LysR family transcriptional regulator [Burkholderia cenocepacia]MDN7558042.1 LysR family transcriptional regulator [Burkholderia orbicola]MDR8056557.1 LysR family transcriptional regulator [Burkholderia cenocepacia]MDR8063347.1 LysR family transcriptional regulator [Burkholderia cenocepacia]MEC4775501.1 LysR family transcriptional regulator [Burkholderia cenocepacia]